MATISVSLPSDGDTIDVADYNTPITTIVNAVNGNLDNDNIAAAAAIAGTKLADSAISTAKVADSAITTAKINDEAVTPAKTSLYNYQTDNSGTIANVTNGAIKIQAGWGQVTGNSSDNVSDAVTFPVAFTTILGVVISPLGALAGSNASSITALTAGVATAPFSYKAEQVTTTGFSAGLFRSAGTFGNTTRYGYSWIAWGIV